jgi:hypothetical protein
VFIIDNSHIEISISCHNLNFNNFWGGEWLSNWKVTFGSTNDEVSGKFIFDKLNILKLGHIKA